MPLHGIGSDKKMFDIKQNIKINGHIGLWYEIGWKLINDKKYYLMESQAYGDLAACIIIDDNNNLIQDDIWNGFNDLEL